MNFQDKKKLDFISNSIDILYQDKAFIDLSLSDRLKRVSDVLKSASEKYKESARDTWNTENRKDSPHHYDNRLD